MKLKNLTLFYGLGLLAIVIGIPYSILLIYGNSVQDGLLGIYLLFGIIPLLVFLLIDRILVRKFGSRKVNLVQFFFIEFIMLFWIVRFIANLF